MSIEKDPHDLAVAITPVESTNGSLTAIPSGLVESKVRDLVQFQSQSIFADTIHLVGGKMLRSLPQPTGSKVSIRFKKSMRGDPPIALGLKTLKAPIRNVESWVDGGKKEVAAFCEEIIKIHQSDLCRKSLRAIEYGWQVCEWVWQRQTIRVDNKRLKVKRTFRDALVPVRFLDLDPQHIEPVIEEKYGTFAGVIPSGQMLEDPKRRLIPRHKLFYTANDPEYGDPRGRSVLDDAYQVYYWCQIAHLMAARYFESRAIPNPVIRCPAGEIPDPATGQRRLSMAIALAAGENLRHGKPAVLPSDINTEARLYEWTMELLQADKRGDEFRDYIAFLNDLKMMAIGIPPKVLLQGSSVGTYAETREITSTWTDTQETLLNDLWVEPVNNQLIPMLVALNFGPEEEQPRFETEGFKKTDQALIARAFEKMLEVKHRINSGPGGKSVDASLYEMLDPVKLARSARLALKPLDELEVAPQAEDKALEAKAQLQKDKESGPSGEKKRDTFTEN